MDIIISWSNTNRQKIVNEGKNKYVIRFYRFNREKLSFFFQLKKKRLINEK